MEVLQIVSLDSMPLYDKHYIGIKETQVIKDPFKLGTIHPVVKRLGIDKSEGYLDYFQEAITYSDEFGEEQGYITQSAMRQVSLVDKDIYEELKARREIFSETRESITKTSKEYEDKIKLARKDYIDWLLDIGYIPSETGDYDEDTKYFMIHPLYIHEWRKYSYPSRYPSWAVKEIGYFPE